MDLKAMLQYAFDQGASDLHLATGRKPLVRVDGELKEIADEKVLKEETLLSMLKAIIPEQVYKSIEENTELDFALVLPNFGRFRVNIFQQLNGLSAAFRTIPLHVKTLEELDMPEVLAKLCALPHGLILVTGPTGSGKSTTLAAMIDYINDHECCHIITIEDPVEFVYEGKKALIQQRELHQHTATFHDALRAALREDPDVILIGEMRDLETIRLALTAAETGHLVLATLHTSSAAKTINRIVDVFPENEKALMRMMLADSLQAVISQVLVKKTGGGRVPVQEIMLCNPAIRNLIRENEIAQIYTVMQTNKAVGMNTFQQAFEELIADKIVPPEEKPQDWFNVVT